MGTWTQKTNQEGGDPGTASIASNMKSGFISLTNIEGVARTEAEFQATAGAGGWVLTWDGGSATIEPSGMTGYLGAPSMIVTLTPVAGSTPPSPDAVLTLTQTDEFPQMTWVMASQPGDVQAGQAKWDGGFTLFQLSATDRSGKTWTADELNALVPDEYDIVWNGGSLWGSAFQAVSYGIAAAGTLTGTPPFAGTTITVVPR